MRCMCGITANKASSFNMDEPSREYRARLAMLVPSKKMITPVANNKNCANRVHSAAGFYHIRHGIILEQTMMMVYMRV
jgi:hypothetical protein